MKRKNKKALDLYIHIHTTVLSAQKGGGLSRSTLGSLHTSREASFMGVFFVCLHQSRLYTRGVVVFFFLPLLLFWSIVHASFFTRA